MTFLNIAVSIPLAKLYGGVGSAAGTALSLVLLNIALMNFYYHFKIGLDMAKFWLNIARMLAPSLLAVAIILPINYALSLSGAAYLLVCGSLYIAIFTFIAVKLVMNDYERAIFGAALAKIRSRL
jgi:virulence factor mvin family protein